MKQPAKNASKARWEDFLRSEGIEVPEDATRVELIEAWEQRGTALDVADVDVTADDDAQRRAAAIMGTDSRESPHADLADQVPDEFRFTTDSGERRDPEKLLISIDGQPCYLYQPPNTSMVLFAAAFTPNTDPAEKVKSILNLVNVSLDQAGRTLLWRMMNSADNSFDDALPGRLAFTILDRWAPTLAAEADLSVDRPQNRAARRQIDRKRR